MSFGNKLKAIRKSLSFTQLEMSDKLLMDQSAYSRYESGKTSPTIDLVKRVSEIFYVDMIWLLEAGNDDVQQKNPTLSELDNEVIQFMLEQQKKLTDLLNKLREGGGGEKKTFLNFTQIFGTNHLPKQIL